MGSEERKMRTLFSSIDLIEEISEKTSLAYPTIFNIVNGLKNKHEIVKNPPYFIYEASRIIKAIELDEMVRGLQYEVSDEKFNFEIFKPYLDHNKKNIEPTPNRCIYDHIVYDSEIEKKFANKADNDQQIVCFLKLPQSYFIETPAGKYNPDFGIVIKKKRIREENESEYYFVIETKGTNDLNDKKALTENEIYKIRCAIKHFEALGIETETEPKIEYIAPIKEYETFKKRL